MDGITLVSYIISIAIPAFAVYLIFAMDFFGTGKRQVIMVCLGWGIIGAFGLAYLINSAIIDYLKTQPFIKDGDEFIFLSTRIAPIVEEILKALILLYFIQQPSFLYFVDGAIYGFAAGMGFAMSENVFYVTRAISNGNDAVLALAINRGLSASLMHATAGAVVGITLGLSRRQHGRRRYIAPLEGVFFAFIVHFIYNNALHEADHGIYLLISAIGIGVGGGILIAVFINNGLANEKKHFEETLGLQSGVSSAERKAVQKMGSEAIEEILEEMAAMFGRAKADLIRRMLIVQANIGILRNNLNSPAGERLKKAWQEEIDKLRAEMDDIRGKLGTYTMTLLRSLLPEDEDAVWHDFGEKVAEYDPTHVHSFDLFMVASELAETFSPEQLEELAETLHQISIFKNVELADLDNLARAITKRQYRHGQMLFDKGAEGDTMYMIERGHIDIFLVDDDTGEQKYLRTYEAGAVVGELALLDGQPRSARARANGPLSVMVLQRKHFMMFIQSRPRVILAVLKFLADRVRYTTDAVTTDPVAKEIDHSQETMEATRVTTDTASTTGKQVVGIFARIATVLEELEAEAASKSSD